MKTVLVTGGLGYIGSHTVVELLAQNFDVVIVDDLSNSSIEVLNNIETIAGKRPRFYQLDLKDKQNVESIFELETIHSVIHFAAHKAVGESVEKPLMYYKNNLLTVLHMLEVMQARNVSEFVFSSSATVYGLPDTMPVKEHFALQPATNPYGNTKKVAEDILTDFANANEQFKTVILRYFNPVGAHESALIGELPQGIPNNLMPYITQTAAGIREQLTIFGDDYETRDGTCIRDFIHVVDLAKAHIAALEYMSTMGEKNIDVFNIGTGRGYTVKEIVETFEAENNVELNVKFGERRMGDIPALEANVDRAEQILGWKAERNLADMVKSSWQFQKQLAEKQKKTS